MFGYFTKYIFLRYFLGEPINVYSDIRGTWNVTKTCFDAIDFKLSWINIETLVLKNKNII